MDRTAAARAPLPFDPTCEACCQIRRRGGTNVAHTCGRQRPPSQPVVRDPTAPAAQTEALAIFLAAEPTDGAAPAAPKKPLALKPLLTPKSKRIATKAMPKFKAKADAAEHETKEALEDDEHPWWYMTAR